MADFSASYTPPGVYTQEVFTANSATLVGTDAIPVLIGEGEEFFTVNNAEMHRGSSPTSDDLIVGENLSAQVDGVTRTFQLSHYPVVSGDGKGMVTNDPTKVQIVAGGIPLTLVSLNGLTGTVIAQTIVPQGTDTSAKYYFKRTDTLISHESLTNQIPVFASLHVGGNLSLGLTIPGELGNNVSFALTQAAAGSNLGVSDALAVTGSGTDLISIQTRKTDDTLRSYQDVANLVNAGIPTLDGGYLTITANSSSATTALASTLFTGGAGPSSNTTFKLANSPIVDGTNGGIVTNNPLAVTARVNGVPVAVSLIDGLNGLITLVAPVSSAPGTNLFATYYTNTYQNTADLIPDANILTLSAVGQSPNRSDYIQGTDFVLNNGTISWGASVNVAASQSTAGFTPIGPADINTTLVDEKVYLLPATGIVNGRNSVFTLGAVPVDGSGLSRATSNPALISVFVGTNPVTALQAGPVAVAGLVGASGVVTLYNPPPTGTNVYVTQYRSTLNDHTYTVTVASAGIPGQGSFTVQDEANRVAPAVQLSAATVSSSNFTGTGIVWPTQFSDLFAPLGAAQETVTLTFQDDGLANVVSPSTQASLTVADGSSTSKITFRATVPGIIGNLVTVSLIGGPTGAADAAAITVSGSAITVATVMADNATTRTWQQIVALFSTYPVSVAGADPILCSGIVGADLTSQAISTAATHLSGGADQVNTAYAQRYTVSSSRTLALATSDNKGRTGGVTTPSTANWTAGNPNAGIGLSGYLGQTYIDPVTGFKLTIVDPKAALGYGYTQLPSPSYSFVPGDTLTFTVSPTTALITGLTPSIAIPGLQTQVISTLGTNVKDTAIISTLNKAGKEPAVGDYYYITYTKAKPASAYGVIVYSKVEDLYAQVGKPSINNRLALGAKFFNVNGGGQFAAIQVQKQVGLGLASDQSFIDAINKLSAPIPGGTQKAGVIVALSSSPTVQQAVNSFMAKQQGPRYKGEATAPMGLGQFATPAIARAQARALKSQRSVLLAPFNFGVLLQASTTADAIEYLVTGEFAAAAMAGLMCNKTNDVATTLTGQTLVGFSRAMQSYDDPTMDLMAADGVTCLVDTGSGLEIRDWVTTDPSNDLTSYPYVTRIADFIAQVFRGKLKGYMGRKMVSELPPTIAAACNSLLKGWNNVLITKYSPVIVGINPNDPTSLLITVSYVPMFSLRTIDVTFSVQLS